jgi:ligand-binding SRPBCC domain-containing protein
MKVELSTTLQAPADQVWRWVQRPALLNWVAVPLVRFRAIQPTTLPEVWADGEVRVSMLLFGVLPIGSQVIRVHREEEQDGAQPARYLVDMGEGDLVKTWHHRIRVVPERAGTTHYTDSVVVEAGPLTLFVWMFAQVFYRHRQRRLRALARGGFKNVEGR